MDGNWLESGDELEARERAEKEARRADEDLSAVASMPEGLRFCRDCLRVGARKDRWTARPEVLPCATRPSPCCPIWRGSRPKPACV